MCCNIVRTTENLSAVFEWTVTGLSGVTFKCSFNGGPQFDCELFIVSYNHSWNHKP